MVLLVSPARANVRGRLTVGGIRLSGRTRRRTRAAIAATAAALISVSASADGATLRYAAPSECPSRGELMDAVERRISGPNAALSATDPALELRIEVGEQWVVGTIRIGDDEPRRLTGNTCAEVVRGAAIVMASRIVKQREGDEAGHGVPASPPVASWTIDARASTAETSLATAPKLPVVADRRPGEAKQRWISPAELFWTLGAGATSRFGIAPRFAWGPFVEGELVGSIWRAQLGIERVATGTFEAPPAQAAVGLLLVRPSGCLHRSFRSFEPRACLGLDFGWFEAEGVASGSIVAGDRVSKPWFGAGPALGVRFRPPLPLDLDLAFALQVPFQRGHLVFETPRTPVHSTGTVVPSLSLSLRTRLQGSKARPRGIAR
jgi:hypothetical protein